MKEYTLEEIAKHNKREDAWVIIEGGVYDLTEYVDDHPGGDEILRNVGGDATTGVFAGQHPENFMTIAERFRIGTVKK